MKRVLFLCTGNSARSQMAEGILRQLAGDLFEVSSAGIHPSVVNPLAIKVMAEMDIDISRHHSKSVTEFLSQSFDTVITVCDNAKESCPILPGHPERIHWSFPDPAQAKGSDEERLNLFRRVRQELWTYLKLFVDESRNVSKRGEADQRYV